MKKALYALALLAGPVFSNQQAHAQAGDLGLGIRLTPDGGGATLKYFATKNVALEGQLNAGGIFGLEGTSVSAVALAEYHIIFPDPSWRVFFGGGVHIGSWSRDNGDGTEFIFGIDAIGGVEYKFKKIPLGLSADLKPAINFVEDVDFFPHNLVGASARFYFGDMHPHHRAHK